MASDLMNKWSSLTRLSGPISHLERSLRRRLGVIVSPAARDEDGHVSYGHPLPRRRVQLFVSRRYPLLDALDDRLVVARRRRVRRDGHDDVPVHGGPTGSYTGNLSISREMFNLKDLLRSLKNSSIPYAPSYWTAL